MTMSIPIKIGIDARVFSKSKSDGTSRYLSGILRTLLPADRCINYYLFSNRPLNMEVHALENWENAKIILDNNNIPGTLWFFFKCGIIVNKMALDFFWAPYPAIPLFRNRKTRYIITVHDLSFYSLPQFLAWDNYILSKCLFPYSIRKADIIFSVSKFTQTQLTHYFNKGCQKHYLTGSSVPDTIKPITCSEIKEKTNLLFIGTFEPRKNIQFLIDNFLAARHRLPASTRLILAGRPGWKFRFKMSFEYYKANNIDVILSPSDDKIAELYSNALLFVFPSLYEGFGIPILEAMRFRVPVLSSNAASLPEIGGDAVEYFNPCNGEEFQNKLVDLVNNKTKRQAFASKHAANLGRFNWLDTAKTVLSVFHRIP